MGRKEKYETPEGPEPLSRGEICLGAKLPCLHEGEARKEARRTPGFQGGFHQALPHRTCGWWHVYLIVPKRRSVTQRKRDAREEYELRQKIENGIEGGGG